jgi:hypothetical protein
MGLVTISEMKILEMTGGVLFLVLYAVAISLLGVGISYLGWLFSRSMRPVSVRTLFRSGLIAITVTPSVYGHAGVLPAIFLAFVLHGRDRLVGIVPILVVWAVAIPIISGRVGNQTSKLADHACAWAIFVLGVIQMIVTEIRHPPHAVLDTPLLWIFVAMFNLLRLRNGSSVRSLTAFCIGANVAALTLEVLRIRMFGLTFLVTASLILVETIFSLIPALPVDELRHFQFGPSFWREVLIAYGFPITMFVLAIIPGFNFTYSGHGGISWLLIPFCFPSVIVRALIKIRQGSEESRRWHEGFSKVTVPAYIALALPLSWAAVTSIRDAFGLSVPMWEFFAIMVSPFPWYYFI